MVLGLAPTNSHPESPDSSSRTLSIAPGKRVLCNAVMVTQVSHHLPPISTFSPPQATFQGFVSAQSTQKPVSDRGQHENTALNSLYGVSRTPSGTAFSRFIPRKNARAEAIFCVQNSTFGGSRLEYTDSPHGRSLPHTAPQIGPSSEAPSWTRFRNRVYDGVLRVRKRNPAISGGVGKGGKPGSVPDCSGHGHLSGMRVAAHLERPSSSLSPSEKGIVRATLGSFGPCTSWGLPSRPPSGGRWWALTPPFHPYRNSAAVCFLLHFPSASPVPEGPRAFGSPPSR